MEKRNRVVTQFEEIARNRWLTGEEYKMILEGMRSYCKIIGLELFHENHPQEIYFSPKRNSKS